MLKYYTVRLTDGALVRKGKRTNYESRFYIDITDIRIHLTVYKITQKARSG